MKRKELIKRRRIDDIVADYNAALLPGEPKMTRPEMVQLVGLVGFATIKEKGNEIYDKAQKW